MALTKTGRMRGGDKILRNLKKELGLIKGDIRGGLLLGLKHIQGEAQEITPEEFGPLVGSAFSDVFPPLGQPVRGTKIIGRVGYTQGYAPFVHEMPADNNFTKPGTGPKFLEKAVLRNARALVKFIRAKAKR